MKSEVKKSVAVGGLKLSTRDTFLTGFAGFMRGSSGRYRVQEIVEKP